jgi:diguanylate cyclase (GGDEF)-like protein
MPQDQPLLSLLVVLVLANMVLLASNALHTRAQRRSSRHGRVRSGREGRTDTPDGRAAAAIEAFVAEVAAGSAGQARPPTASQVISWQREAITAPAARTPHAPDLTPAGLADPATWDRAIHEESARMGRFGRPVTVVMAELRHLDDVADRLGRDVADRVVTEIACVLAREGRAADRIAWLGGARFGVLLVETEELMASRYVERLRTAADSWLESAGLSIRLSLGWASPAHGGDIKAAATMAHERMHDAHRHSSRGSMHISRVDPGRLRSQREGQPVTITSARSRVPATSPEFDSSLRTTQARASSSDLP